MEEAQQAGLALDAYTCSALVQGRLGVADFTGAWQALADMRAAGVCPTKVLLQLAPWTLLLGRQYACVSGYAACI